MTKTATLYRMDIDGHTCPHGLRSKDLLQRYGFAVQDNPLTSRDAVDAFKAEHNVPTTPQTFIDGTRIGGFDDLSAHLTGRQSSDDQTTYQPVIALFSVSALMAIALTWLVHQNVFTGQTILWFISISMILLGLQKLKDIEQFATMFLSYDLLARRWVRYGYIYPFIETLAGLSMLAGVLVWLSAPIALVAAGIGAISVFKAVYIDKRALKCACVGGDSKVPLGFVSLTENLMMAGMAIYMIAQM
ncbi:MAG: MauE/DoxX family redox-associated membrane protein [Pseudomonadota bacterium]